MDNAYWLWTFQGRLLQKNNKDRFCQLLWRPRPPTLLSQDQIKVWGPRGRGNADALVALTEETSLCCSGCSHLSSGNGLFGVPFEEMREHWRDHGEEWFQDRERGFAGCAGRGCALLGRLHGAEGM